MTQRKTKRLSHAEIIKGSAYIATLGTIDTDQMFTYVKVRDDREAAEALSAHLGTAISPRHVKSLREAAGLVLRPASTPNEEDDDELRELSTRIAEVTIELAKALQRVKELEGSERRAIERLNALHERLIALEIGLKALDARTLGQSPIGSLLERQPEDFGPLFGDTIVPYNDLKKRSQ